MKIFVDEIGDICIEGYDDNESYNYILMENLIKAYEKAGYDISITKKDIQIKDD